MGKGEAKEVRKKGAIKERENASFFVAPDSEMGLHYETLYTTGSSLEEESLNGQFRLLMLEEVA